MQIGKTYWNLTTALEGVWVMTAEWWTVVVDLAVGVVREEGEYWREGRLTRRHACKSLARVMLAWNDSVEKGSEDIQELVKPELQ